MVLFIPWRGGAERGAGLSPSLAGPNERALLMKHWARMERTPSCEGPGFLSLIAQIRQATMWGIIWGDGVHTANPTPGGGALSGAGCHTVSLTRES